MSLHIANYEAEFVLNLRLIAKERNQKREAKGDGQEIGNENVKESLEN